MLMFSVQSLLLVLAAFLAGAMIACFLRRVFFVRDNEHPTPSGGRTHQQSSDDAVTSTKTVKMIETQTVTTTETSRFGRALTGAGVVAGGVAAAQTATDEENSEGASDAVETEIPSPPEAQSGGEIVETIEEDGDPSTTLASSPSAVDYTTADEVPTIVDTPASTPTVSGAQSPSEPEPASSPSIPTPVAVASGEATQSEPPSKPDASDSSTAYFKMLRSVRSEALIGSVATPANEENIFRLHTARGVDVDDLKRIRGIGVLIEKKLNAMGVQNYEQIANWTAEDVSRVSQTLDFKGRIERESWIEQARILASGGFTEFSRRG